MIKQIALLVLFGCTQFFAIAHQTQERDDEAPVVTTPLGQIRGSIIVSRLGKPIYSFRGIRYAKAPVNELRFKPPVPVEKWEGVYNATEDGPMCPQPTKDPVSEDCLSLNVYSTELPKRSRSPKRPVIVYIHAGGYYSVGSASYWAGPNYFMDQDIVLVTINYRLGTLGFLSTGDAEAPGNNGLKDQVQALKWVKQNIESFGGNEDSVTIMGYSAGGVSVILHMVSPMSRGLFHKAIAMSGSPLGNWLLPHNQLDLAKKQARFVDCPDDTASNIIRCLKTKPFKELGDSLPKFKEFARDPVLIWSPVIEPDFGQERFLTAHPISLIVQGKFQKIPLITGITAEEFGHRAFPVIYNNTLMNDMNRNFEKIAPIAFLYERDTENSKTISKALKRIYFNNEPIQLTSLAQLYADSIIGFSVNRAAKLISTHSNSPVYYYLFRYKGRYSHFYTPGSNYTEPYGVVHHDDLIYLFYIQRLFPLFEASSPVEVEMVSKLTSLYAGFAKTGNPTQTATHNLDNVKWEPFTARDQKYLDIANKLSMKNLLYQKRYAQWEKLFPIDQYLNNTRST